jgi:SHS2 domain-containing protein
VSASHRFEDHTGEVAIAIEASTVEEVFLEAARALAVLVLGEGAPPPPATGPALEVAVEAPDPAALLVEWLNELVYRTDVERAVFTEVAFTRLEDRALAATVRGVREAPLRLEVKAATLHQARLEATEGGYRAHVVLDV